MKRTVPLPAHLVPWFTVEQLTGTVTCKRCPATFVGNEAREGSLARHVSYHLIGRPAKAPDPAAGQTSG